MVLKNLKIDCGASWMKKHIAIYGTTKIKRRYCSHCDTNTFVVDGTLQCCLSPDDSKDAKRYRRISQPCGMRRLPPLVLQKEIIAKQNNCCIYCDIKFGETYYKLNRCLVSKIHWDHLVPFAYLQDNPYTNWVASCNVCNHIKSSRIFETIDEAKNYVKYYRKKKEIYYEEDLSPAQEDQLQKNG